MPSNIQLQNMRDWTGGLNLRADTVQLEPNESPDMLNVDCDARGGFHQRWGVTTYSTTQLGNKAVSAWEFATTLGVRQALFHDGNAVWSSTGGAFTNRFSRSGVCRAATLKDRSYVQNGTQAAIRWDGTTATTLTVAQGATGWNNEPTAAAPDALTGLEFPLDEGTARSQPVGKLVAAHMGHLWVANTLENGVRQPNRLRYSFPNYPENWRSYDYIDIDPGVDGDEITALVPFNDRLLVFKRRSIHAVYGSDPETFQVFPISVEVGAVSQEAVVGTDLGVYFFSWPDGVFLYDGKQPTWKFDRIMPAIADKKIPQAYSGQIHLGWGGRRLWVSVPWKGSTSPTRVFILDPTLSKQGSWTAYDLSLTAFVEYNPPGADSLLLACDKTSKRVVKLDQRVPYDNFGASNVPITTLFRTSWIDLGEQALKKRWKRPEFMMQGGTTATVTVRCFHDWDPSFAVRQFKLNTVEDADTTSVVVVSPSSGAVTGTGWGSAQWGTATWGRSGTTGGPVPGSGDTKLTGRAVLQKGVPLGQSKSVGFEFVGPATNQSWGVDSIALKFIPRRIRS